MKYIRQVETADGKVHVSEEAARKYLDAKFGDIIVPLARTVAEIEKFKAALDFIEQNLPLFVRLHDLKLDMSLGTEENEEHEG